MLSPWQNVQVNVLRRDPSAARNSLNEPDYGEETGWPVAYGNLWVRIEYPDEQLAFTETGERVQLPTSAAAGVNMYVEPEITIKLEDRVVIASMDDRSLLGQLYIVTAVYPEWDSIGAAHHYIVELSTH